MLTARTYPRPAKADQISRDVEELISEYLARESVKIQARDWTAMGGSPAFVAVGTGLTPAWSMAAATNTSLIASAFIPSTWKTYSMVAIGATNGAGTGDLSLKGDYASGSNVGQNASFATYGTAVTAAAGAQNIITETVLQTGLTTTGAQAFQVGRRSAADTLTVAWALLRVELRRTS